MAGLGDNIRKNTEEQKKFNEAASEGLNSFRDYTDILKSINEELGKQYSTSRQARNEYDSLISISQKLTNQEEGISRLKDDQLKKLSEQAKANVANIKHLADSLTYETAITDQEIALLMAKEETFAVEEDYLKKIQHELKIRQDVNKAMGVTGNVLEGLNEIGGKFAKALNLDQVAEDMREFAEETIRAEGSVSRLSVLGKGITSAFKSLATTLTDPAVVIAAMVDGFNEVNKAQVEFTRLTGEQIDHVDTLNMHYLTSADYIKAATELTKEFGMNAANIFTKEDITEFAEMTEEIGIAGDKAAQLAKFSKLTGGSLKENNKSLVDGVNSYNKQNQSAVNGRMVLDQVANVSNSLAVTYAGYPEKLGAAAAAAQRFGMSMQDIEKIADSLLNFEQSISAELEAELLTGKSLNLEKAREAALNNDIETLTNEIAANVGNSADFAKMNRIEQKALADAVGMTKDELAGMLIAKDIEAGLSEDALTAAQKQQYEQYKSITAQEKFNKSIEKLQQALAPIIGFFADIVSNSYVLYSIIGVALLSKIGVVAKHVTSIASGFKDAWKSAKGLVQGVAQMATGKGADKLKETLSGAGDKTKDLQGKTEGAQGAGPGGFLKSLGDGLASIGKQFTDVVKGALALGIAGLALGGSFALALMMVKDVDPVQMVAFAGSLTMLGLTMALLGKIGSQVIQGALAMAILGVGLIPAAYAFSLLSGLDTDALIAFSIALPLLSLAAAGLGFIAPFIMMGAAALAVLGLALIPAAYGFSLLQGLDVNAVMSFAKGVGVLAVTAALMGFASPLIIAGAFAMTALGLAMLPLAEGFERMGAVDTTGMISGFTQLASLAPGLTATAAALFAVAGGMTAVAVAGYLAVPAMALMSMFSGSGEGGSKEEGSLKKVEEKLDQLITIVAAGGDVYIDGNKVGKTIALASSKLG